MISHTQSAVQQLNDLEKETRRIFQYEGEIQKNLDDIEDGLWGGRKVTPWNTWFFPCSVADDETLKELRTTYKIWLSKYHELGRKAGKLHRHYTTIKPCKVKQGRVGSVIYQLELGSSRLINLCTTARTGIPFCSWSNRHAIKSLDFMDKV